MRRYSHQGRALRAVVVIRSERFGVGMLGPYPLHFFGHRLAADVVPML